MHRQPAREAYLREAAVNPRLKIRTPSGKGVIIGGATASGDAAAGDSRSSRYPEAKTHPRGSQGRQRGIEDE
jgi:hypothetical protein